MQHLYNLLLYLGVFQYKGGEKMKRKLIENTRSITMSMLKGLEQGEYTITWGDDASATVVIHDEYIKLYYVYEKKKLKMKVSFNYTKVGYGIRKWFSCPTCSRKTNKLYYLYGLFACRICHNLTYRSSNASGNKLNELALKIKKVQRRLKAKPGTCINKWHIPKPKGMHESTYLKLKWELMHLQAERDKAWMKMALK